MSFSIIIPSKSASNLVPCIRAIRDARETARIIVVDDGVDFACLYKQGLGPYLVEMGVKPFVFARNVNIGILAAGDDDVIVLNDDALLKTPHGFTRMRQCTGGTDFGLLAASCNMVGNANQHQQLDYASVDPPIWRGEPRMVCFVCVYIPRTTINAVGLLDERFVHYGMDDDDYCLRVRNAGLKLGIFDGCFVDHGSLESSYRGGPRTGGNFRPNMKLFIEKWGVDNWGRDKAHSEFASLFP